MIHEIYFFTDCKFCFDKPRKKFSFGVESLKWFDVNFFYTLANIITSLVFYFLLLIVPGLEVYLNLDSVCNAHTGSKSKILLYIYYEYIFISLIWFVLSAGFTVVGTSRTDIQQILTVSSQALQTWNIYFHTFLYIIFIHFHYYNNVWIMKMYKFV